jgi:hypothetical protein
VPPAAYAPRSVPPTAYGPRPGYRPPPPYRYYKKKDDDSGPFDRFFKDGRGPDPTRWFKAGDPEEGLAEMWEDLINAPTEWGEYPGGFYAPEIGVPNPIDVEKELRDAPPELMDTLPDIININPPGKSFDDSW